MGVDISIPNDARAQHPLAGCRGYVFNSPTYILSRNITERAGIISARYIIPLAAIPMHIRLANGGTLEREVGTPQRFGVELIAIHARRSRREKYYIKRWLSQPDYETLKPSSSKRTPWHSNTEFTIETRKTVCGVCPLKLPFTTDCHPRLFSYGKLTSLRKAATEFLLTAPFPVYREVNQLINEISVIFPTQFEGNRPSPNLTEEHDVTFHAQRDSLRAQGYQILDDNLNPESATSPLSAETIAPLADALLAALFFRPEDDIISADKLFVVVNWLEQLLNSLHHWQQVKPLSAELTDFRSVMEIYTSAHKNAMRFNLSIGLSW